MIEFEQNVIFQAENIIFRPKNVPFRIKFGFENSGRIRSWKSNSTKFDYRILHSKFKKSKFEWIQMNSSEPSLIADIHFLLFWSPKPFTSIIIKTLLGWQNVCWFSLSGANHRKLISLLNLNNAGRFALLWNLKFNLIWIVVADCNG